ncbi:hypothetical protein ACFX2A_034779 [Malus domestica]
MIKAATVEMGKILSLFMVEANKNNIDDNGISRLPTRRAALHPYITSIVTRSMTLTMTFIIIDEREGDEEEHVSESEWLESVNTNAYIDLLHFVDVEVQSSYWQTSLYT